MNRFLQALAFLSIFFFSAPASAQDARWGYQLSFDGTNDYFTANSVSSAVTGSNWTIEFWFRSARTVTYTEAIFAFNPSNGTNRIEIGVGPNTSTNKMYIYSPNSSPTTLYGTTVITPNTWYHVAVTFNTANDGIMLYVNGNSTPDVSRVLPAGDYVQSTDQFSLGQEWDNASASGFFSGQLDEVRVWSSVRSNTNINDYMYQEVPTNSSGLLAYYKMTNNTGTSVTDNTGNSRTGTLVNGTAWQTSTVTKPSNGTVSSDQTIDEGDQPAAITITNVPYNNIQWQESPNGTDWTNISGATTGTLTGAQTGTLDETSYFRARLDNGYGTYDYGNTITITVIPGTLPVSWLSFTGQKKGAAILLAWRTAAEENVDHFEIQHSTNAVNWKSIGAVNTTGNSSYTKHYELLHTDPANGANHYRIAEIATDGQRSYSNTISISNKSEAIPVLLYPNPVTSDFLTVKLETLATIRIINVQGAVLLQKKLAAGIHTIPVSRFSKGHYWLNTESGSVKFIVQ